MSGSPASVSVGLLDWLLSPDGLKAGATFVGALIAIALMIAHRPWLKILGGVLAVISASIGLYLAKEGSIRSKVQAAKEAEQASALDASASRIASLEERLTPRELYHPELLVAAIAAFPSVDNSPRMSVKYDTDAEERIAEDIWHTVFQSVAWGSGLGGGWRRPPGMTLYIATDATPREKAAAIALASGLRAAGITDLEGPMPFAPANATTETITLTIGAKK
jgi:uncharacterized membrane protein